MSEVGKIERAIATINFIKKKRERKVEAMSKRMDLNADQKIFIGEELDLLKNIEVLVAEYRKDLNRNLGRVPPQAMEMEQAVLGAIMLHQFQGIFEKVGSFLKSNHFYTEGHQELYKCFAILHLNLQPLDTLTVARQLRKAGTLEVVGGASYLAELEAKVVSPQNAEQHARIVVEQAIKRQLIVTASQLLTDGYEDTADCFEMLEYAEGSVKEIKSWVQK